MAEFTDEDVLAIVKRVMGIDCGYCMDGRDLDGPTCPECGAKNLHSVQEPAKGGES